VDGNPRTFKGGYSVMIMIEGETLRFIHVVDGHCLAFLWHKCYLLLVSPSLDIVQILLHLNMDSANIPTSDLMMKQLKMVGPRTLS
ncbi:hypothetical protein, partial [Proteus mirabilis]|uniref:hypothetical protein n=1 Tax=Proteus mirabilis TaxID=584 RepID=UPI001C8961C1